MQHRLANFLLMYRSTPHTVTGVSTAELFLKRQMRTWFNLLKPSLTETVEEKQQNQKKYHDKGRTKLRELSEGDHVHVRNFREGKERWIRGTVVKQLGPVSYLINDSVRKRMVHIDHLPLLHEEVVGCNISSDDTHLTPDLDLPQPSNSIPEAEGRIPTPVHACSLEKPAALPARLSPASCPHSPAQYGNTPGKPAEPVAVSATTQQLGRCYPDGLWVPPKTLNL